MKSRILFFIAVGLLLLGVTLFIFSTRNQEPAQVFSATINRDCAPWDGTAFMVSIPYTPGTMIRISIWQAPDMKYPVTFSFPDDSGEVGNATFLLRYSYSVQLTGRVFFSRVEQGVPVEGRFDFVTEAGQRIKGTFIADWEDEIVLCG